LRALFSEYGGALLSYESLSATPERVLRPLMEMLGVSFHEEQLAYHQAGPQVRKVMGDVTVATSPRPLDTESSKRRSEEEQQHRRDIDSVLASQRSLELLGFCGAVRRAGYTTSLPTERDIADSAASIIAREQ
jgi:hypothetical protein